MPRDPDCDYPVMLMIINGLRFWLGLDIVKSPWTPRRCCGPRFGRSDPDDPLTPWPDAPLIPPAAEP